MIKILKEKDAKEYGNFIKGATLLSKDEWLKFGRGKGFHPGSNFWLRSVDCPQHNGNFVVEDIMSGYARGDVHSGIFAPAEHAVTCPALIIDLSGTDLRVGKEFCFGGRYFKIISDNLAFTGTPISGYVCFRKNFKNADPIDYEHSEVKKVVDDWFAKSMAKFNS